MRTKLALAFAGIGAFSLGSQTALFREYLVVYGGNELGTGFFLSSWLLWVGVGAIAARRWLGGLRTRLPELLLLYPVALALQLLLIRSLRDLAGVAPTDLFPTRDLFLLTFLTNAPVSFVTGLIFPMAAAAAREAGSRAAVSRVYVFECLGSFAGGAGVTAFLACSIGAMNALAVLTATLSAAGLALSLATRRRVTAAGHSFLVTAALVFLVPGVGSGLVDRLDRMQWDAQFPGATHLARFESPYRRLDVGTFGGQTVFVANGGILAAFPGGDAAAENAALLLAQPAKTDRVLLLGAGQIPLLAAMLEYPVKEAVLVAPDREGFEFLRAHLPKDHPLSDPRVTVRHDDPRRGSFRKTAGAFDLIVVDPGDPDTVLAARYFTREFYEAAKERLVPGGVLATPIRSAENYLGTELTRYGASVRATLAAVFPEVVIAPGERAWFLAGTAPGRVSVDATVLEARLREISGPSFPPERIHTRLSPGRVAFVSDLFAARPGEDLVSTDDRPKVYLLNLLVMGRVEGAGLTDLARGLAAAGILVLLLPVLLVGAVRLRYAATRGDPAGARRFGGVYLLSLAGGASIALDLVLLLRYQERFGLLFTNVGLANALLLLGLTAGGVLGRVVGRPRPAFAAGAGALAAAWAFALPALADAATGEVAFLTLFFGTGVVTGIPFSVAAALLGGAGRTGSVLEAADHLGGAAGAALAGVLLVPLFGAAATSYLLGAMLLAASLLIAIETRLVRGREPREVPATVRAGYVLTAVVLAAAVVSFPVRREMERPRVRIDAERLRFVVAADRFVAVDEPFLHYDAWRGEAASPANHTLSTMAVVTDVTGYGGPLNLLLSIDRDGTIRRVELIESRETPAYITELPGFLDRFGGLAGDTAFRLVGRGEEKGPADLARITGATVTCRAAVATVNRARDRVYRDLLGRDPPGGAALGPRWTLETVEILTIVLFVLAVPVFLRAGRWTRVAFLAVAFGLLGIYANQQLSAGRVFELLALSLPPVGNTAHFLLIVGALVLAVLFGPVYCGLLCPFGAAQELLGRLGLARRPTATADRRARWVKHVVLAVAATAFLLAGAERVLAFDPLAVVFSGRASGTMWLLIGLVAVASLFLFRFWCRYLCPVGAFLSFGNRLGVLSGIARRKNYTRCDLGVRDREDLDCIQCNRCVTGETTVEPEKSADRRLIIGIVAALVVMAVLVFAPGGDGTLAAGDSLLPGQPRSVDMDLLRRRLIREELSDREALYYRKGR